MEPFKINIELKTGILKIFVLPFEIPGAEDVAGYLIVKNDVTLGSIKLGHNSRWITEDPLPWSDTELQMIGDEIAEYFLLTCF